MADQFSELRRKSRILDLGSYRVRTDHYAGREIYNTELTQGSRAARQVTLSEGHQWPPPSRRNHGDIGGAFRTQRFYFTDRVGGRPMSLSDFPIYESMDAEFGKPTGFHQVCTGQAFPITPPTPETAGWPPSEASPESLLKALGTSAIARCKPTNAVADLSVLLGELYKEGLPSVPGVQTWQNRTNLARGAGSEYLNYVFGWAPLVSEVKDLATAITTAEKVWKQYKRDAGRVVRRSYRFPTDRTSAIISTQTNRTFAPSRQASNLFPDTGTLTRTRYIVRKRWFDGAFSYYLPDEGENGNVGSFLQKAAYARKIYGLTLDPEVLWNLAPWSWAIDWFVNAGDVISNLTDMASDGLVVRYGYMMEHVTVTDEYRLAGIRAEQGAVPNPSVLCCVTETKQRVKASPYGFGLTWESFSPRQLAIIAALGITKSSRAPS